MTTEADPPAGAEGIPSPEGFVTGAECFAEIDYFAASFACVACFADGDARGFGNKLAPRAVSESGTVLADRLSAL